MDSGDSISWYYPYVWNSYPYEYPRVTFEDPELAKGFYYTSGMESFISTMETNALMGMNVAKLILDDYLQLLEEPMENISQQAIFAEEKKPEL
jgi:prenylcysteine oxidase/farnesylcysteine lyase